MKKILLLPTALAVTCAPLISLVACNPQQPMPPGPIDPYVTDEEMENAISFRDEEYVQALQSIDSVNCALYELSPTIYHIRDTYDSYEDEYIIRNGSFYSKIYRTSDEAEWEICEAVAGDFDEPEIAFQSIYLYYLTVIAAGITYEFDDVNECYTATIQGPDVSLTYAFYFANKKLVKCYASIEEEGSKTESIFEFSYEKENPQLPHNPKLGDGDITTAMEEAISLANIEFAQAFIENYDKDTQPTIGETQLSPSVFYKNSIEGSKGNAKEYVVKNESTDEYTKISRPSETSEWQKEAAGEEEFMTVQKMGEMLTNMYSMSMVLIDEDPYQYDDQEECYRKGNDQYLFRWYFDNKRLTKFHFLSLDGKSEIIYTLQYDMLTPEAPLPVQIIELYIPSSYEDWFKNAYYKLCNNEFSSDGSPIICRLMRSSSTQQKLDVDVESVKVDDQAADYEYDGWTITIPNQTEGSHKIEIMVKFNKNYRSVRIDLANDSPEITK